MDEKLTSNNIDEYEFSIKNNQDDYENLIIRLKEISSIISSLENEYLDKF